MNQEFIKTIRKNDINLVKTLLTDPRVDPAAGNNYAIKVASDYGHTEVVRLLLNDPRVNPAADNNFAIRWASENGQMNVVKLLLTDKRVDWRLVNNNIKNELIRDNENQIKSELTAIYLSLERSSPQTIISGRAKSQVPKEIIRQTAYMGLYRDLYETVKISEIPPIKLLALAKILNVDCNNKIEWFKLCNNIKQAITSNNQ